MFRTWLAAVFSLMTSCPAISRLLAPAPSRRSTSISRLVSPSGRPCTWRPLAITACEHAGDPAEPARLGDGQGLLGQLLRPGQVLPGAPQVRRMHGQGLGLVQRRPCPHVKGEGGVEAIFG